MIDREESVDATQSLLEELHSSTPFVLACSLGFAATAATAVTAVYLMGEWFIDSPIPEAFA